MISFKIVSVKASAVVVPADVEQLPIPDDVIQELEQAMTVAVQALFAKMNGYLPADLKVDRAEKTDALETNGKVINIRLSQYPDVLDQIRTAVLPLFSGVESFATEFDLQSLHITVGDIRKPIRKGEIDQQLPMATYPFNAIISQLQPIMAALAPIALVINAVVLTPGGVILLGQANGRIQWFRRQLVSILESQLGVSSQAPEFPKLPPQIIHTTLFRFREPVNESQMALLRSCVLVANQVLSENPISFTATGLDVVTESKVLGGPGGDGFSVEKVSG